MINLWATWCLPCKIEMPALDRLQEFIGDEQFEVIAIAVEKTNILKIQEFYNEIDIGLEYKKKGFYTVVIEEPAIIDLGAGRGCDDPTRIMPNRRKTNAPRGIKRLWKHIKTMKF